MGAHFGFRLGQSLTALNRCEHNLCPNLLITRWNGILDRLRNFPNGATRFYGGRRLLGLGARRRK